MVDLPHNIGYNSNVDVTIQTRNCKGEKCTKGGHHILIEFKSAEGNITIGKVKDNNDGSYVASFVAVGSGDASWLSLLIVCKLREVPTNSVIVGRNYQGIKMEIVNDHGRMGATYGIVSKDGMWVVADYTGNCVYIYNGQGRI